MQIFVKQATAGSTLVFSCSEKTTLQEFLQWVDDKTAIPEEYYYITYNGHYVSKYTDEQKNSTFSILGIIKDSTIVLNGRMCVRPCPKKLNVAA